MPIKIKDAEGNEVEVYTKEDFDAALDEATSGFTAQLEALQTDDDNDNQGDDDENKGGDQNKEGDKGNEEEPPAWAKGLMDQVNSLQSNQSSSHINKVTQGLDADKAKEVTEKFESLQGYESTPDGLQRRAEDAHLLVTGEKFDVGGFDVGQVHNAGGERSNGGDDSSTYTAEDKGIQEVLGVSEEDVKKYGKGEGNQ